jgi:protein SCO1/2
MDCFFSIRFFCIALLPLFICALQTGAACAGDTMGDHSGHPVRDVGVKAIEQEASGRKWIDEKTGNYIPLPVEFVTDDGRKVTLGSIIDRPTIILPIYFYCPAICSQNLANLAVALSGTSFVAGRDFKVISLSFNEKENFEVARRAKENYLKIAGEKFPASDWFFLTGKKNDIKAVTDSLGFRFKRMDDTTFIHASALIIVSGNGRIIRYVYGSFLAGDIDMALLDAQKGHPSLSVKRLLAFCFNYDPDTNKPLFQTIKIAVLTLFALILGFIFFYFKKEQNRGGRNESYGSSKEDNK